MNIQGIAIMFAIPSAGLVLAWLALRLLWPTKRANAMADLAWQCAGELLGMKGGSCPPVSLRKKPKGKTIGNYAWLGLPLFGPAFQRIWVVDIGVGTYGKPEQIFANMAHEMTHAKRRQAGKPNDGEVTAEKIEAAALGWAAKSHPNALAQALAKLGG